MGKRVLVSLLASALIFLVARNGGAQEVQPTPEPAPQWSFQPGAFLTADDYEYLESALGCVNLKPSDLNYEKKHRPDDKFRLKVCDDSLDHPLGVPRTAELAAQAFSAAGDPTGRARHASALLDAATDRWSDVEVAHDGETRKALQDKAEAIQNAGDPAKARALLDKAFERALFGGEATQVQDLPEAHAKAWQPEMYALGQELFVPLAALARAADPDGELVRSIGRAAPNLVAESEISIPGCEDAKELAEWFDQVDVAAAMGTFRAADLTLVTLREKWVEGYTNIIEHEDGDAPYAGPASTVKGVTGGVLAAWEGPYGKLVIGGEGPNTYEGDDFIGIIDLGGDDVYRGRVACGLGIAGHAPISFVLDCGGNDRYEGGDFTQGFGFYGVGILHDLGGGDDYYKSRFCSQGCGLCGYGEIYDDGGDDEYRCDSASQGAGCFGYGQLTDASGNDSYRGCRFVQGFAQVMGVGVLTDGAGNDDYYAGGKYLHQPLWNDRYQSLSQGFSIGNRNDSGVGTGGGVALLLDEGDGNDVYTTDIYGQGSSYWYSLGMLVDTGGNDTFTLGQYGQGAGIHLSAAILVDLSGNDTYSMGVGLGQGAAHDWAVGWQIDRAGNDFYQGNGQGMGLNFSVGILLDCAGDDSHCTNNEGSIGKGSNNDISLLLDLAGTDSYGPKEVKDGQFTRRGDHQLVYDVPTNWFPGIDESTLPTVQYPAPTNVVVQHILVAWDGTGVDTQKSKRTKEDAQTLANKILKLARTAGADWSSLQDEYNEDCGPDGNGGTYAHNEYPVSSDAGLVKPFKDLSLSLGAGQIGICESKYGFHIIKRIE